MQLVAAGAPPAASQAIDCQTDSALVRLDHVTIAVTDLPAATTRLEEELGFSVKPGRRHANGLLNAHVRFADGSAIELITTRLGGHPDALSDWYGRFLKAGGGGAFVALDAGPADSVLDRLGDMGSGVVVHREPALEWVSFPEGHVLHSLFFVHVRNRRADTQQELRHANGATGLSAVWIESADPEVLASILGSFGALGCGGIQQPLEPAGVAFGLRGGTIVAVPMASSEVDPRVRRIRLSGRQELVDERVGGVWIEWAGEGL